jgi:enolase
MFIVLRHGESVWNKENKFTGWVDVGLSEKGQQEALLAGDKLKNYNFDNIIISDLKRTKQTAILILKNKPLLEKENIIFTVSSAVKERNYGDLAGIVKSELKEQYGEEQMRIWRRSYYERPPGGENLEDVRIRIGSFFDEIILPLLKAGKNVLLVSHGNALRALFVHLGFKDEKSVEHFELATATPICIDYLNNSSLNMPLLGAEMNGGLEPLLCASSMRKDLNKDYHYLNDYELVGRQIIDSRGFPTIEVACLDKATNKFIGKGSSPSGASCGSSEVLELRDGNPSLFKGKSVFKAIENVELINKRISLNSSNFTNLTKIDEQLNTIDGTDLKMVLGGNTTTAVSFCMADVAAKSEGLEMFEYIQKHYGFPKINNSITPFVNIINGGKHGVTDDLKIQEFMIFPNEKYSVSKKIQIVCEVYHTLKGILVEKYGKQAKSIGDEGGFCPPIYNAEEALSVIEESITAANYKVGEDVFMALDCAASEFYNTETKLYEVEKDMFLTSDQLIYYYGNLIEKHPALKSIEDGFHEHDYVGWQKFTQNFGDQIMIVGDDLFTTNSVLIKKGLAGLWANTLLLKVNQIGTITEAIESAKMMFAQGKNVIVSHRSGETNHAYIVDIAVGIGAKYLKIGSPCRGERVAKFNRLIEIDSMFFL